MSVIIFHELLLQCHEFYLSISSAFSTIFLVHLWRDEKRNLAGISFIIELRSGSLQRLSLNEFSLSRRLKFIYRNHLLERYNGCHTNQCKISL